MAEGNVTRIRIEADGTMAIEGIGKVDVAMGRLESKTGSVIGQMKQHWIGYTAAIYAAYASMQKLWDLAERAAEHEERMDTLNRLTSMYGETADSLVGKIQNVSRGLIGAAAAADVATDALAKGFTPEQVVRMAALAETLAETSSESMTTADAFKRMEESIVTAREKGVVKMFGATIDLEAALGKQAAMLSKAEKAQAIFNMAMEQGEKRMKALGDSSDTTADKMARFKIQIEGFKLAAGDILTRSSIGFWALAQSIAGSYSIIVGALTRLLQASGWLTDSLGITEGRAEHWKSIAESMRQSGEDLKNQARVNFELMLEGPQRASKGGGGAIDRAGNENVKRAEQIAEMMRKIAEERDLAEAADIDKDRIRQDAWFDEQVKKLRELGAEDKHYSELVIAYTAKRNQSLTDQANKLSDFYLDVQRQNAKENDEIEKDRSAAIFRERERAAKERMVIEDAYAKVWGVTESETIRRKAAGEQEILGIRQEGLLASITEQTTFAETLKIMQQHRDLENQIEESKRRQVTDLDVRRLEIEREITELTRQQNELLQQRRAENVQSFLSQAPGGADMARGFGVFKEADARQSAEAQAYANWEAMQDQKIEKMLEQGKTEAELRDYYREYEIVQDEMAMQRKLQIAQGGFAMMSGLAQAFYSMSGQKSKESFALYKAFAIAETTVGTFRAAQDAYAWGAKWGGPILGGIFAATAVAAGMARVAAISSQQMGGSASASAGGGGGGYSSPSGPVLPAAAAQPATKAGAVVNIHVYGNVIDQDKFAREIVPAITKAIEDGVR